MSEVGLVRASGKFLNRLHSEISSDHHWDGRVEESDGIIRPAVVGVRGIVKFINVGRTEIAAFNLSQEAGIEEYYIANCISDREYRNDLFSRFAEAVSETYIYTSKE